MSTTYIGIIVMLLSTVLPLLGLTVGTEQLTTTVTVLLQIVGGVLAMWGRYRLGGITAYGTRK